MDIFELGILGAGAVGYGLMWKSGLLDSLGHALGSQLRRTAEWLNDPAGDWVNLALLLPYADFAGDVVETVDGYIWAGVEAAAIPTDGFANADWNALRGPLTQCLAALPDGTKIQTVCSVSHDAEGVHEVFQNLAGKTRHSSLITMGRARKAFILEEARQGRARTWRYYVFIGQELPRARTQAPLSAIISRRSAERVEKKTLDEAVLRVKQARDSFCSAYSAAGGAYRRLSAREIFELAYQGLNPERSKTQVAPQYGLVVEGRGEELLPIEDLFAISPSEALAFGTLLARKDHLALDNLPTMVLSLQKLPTDAFVGLSQILTRSDRIDFPFEYSAHFTVGDQSAWSDKLEKKGNRLNVTMQQYDLGMPTDLIKKSVQRDESMSILKELLTSGEKIGEFGLTIKFYATDAPTLMRRRDLMLTVMRSLRGLEGVYENHVPLDQWISSLPCGSGKDVRKKPCLTRDAASLMPFVGAPVGMPLNDALDIFTRPDGGLFYWNPRAKVMNSGMSLFCGEPGSGKSGGLNRQRSTLLMAGYRGVTIDFGGSSFRLCKAVGGGYLDIADARKVRGLGLFSIRPQPGEEFAPDELSPEGLPLDRLGNVQLMLEFLCLDPTKPKESALPPEMVDVLNRSIAQTYERLVDETPVIDDFIRALELAGNKDIDIAKVLAARLRIFATQGALGRFLNDRSVALPIDRPYTVFDFRGALDDPRMMLIAALAVNAYLNRFLRHERHIPKFVDIDELQQIKDSPLMRKIIDRVFRTARKLNGLCSAASQSPDDYETEEMKGIAASCEIKWLFRTNQVKKAAEVFELPQGAQYELEDLRATTSTGFRDVVLIWPGGGCARLRLKMGKLDQRILLGAGREQAGEEEAAAVAAKYAPGGVIPLSLKEAIVSDALGMEEVQVGKHN
jgi:hypothetical protein